MSYDNNNSVDGAGTTFHLAGGIGIEYNFPGLPILISFDKKLEFNFSSIKESVVIGVNSSGLNLGLGFGIRS